MEMMPVADCLYHLSTARFGRVAFQWDGYPIILPVTLGMQGDSGVFRTNVGSKLDAALLSCTTPEATPSAVRRSDCPGCGAARRGPAGDGWLLTAVMPGDGGLTDEQYGRRFRTAGSGPRLLVMLVVGLVVAGLVGVFGEWVFAPVAGWAAAAVVFDVWVWLSVARMNAEQTATHATREDPSRGATEALVLWATVINLGAVGLLLVAASSAKGAAAGLLAGGAIVSVALSWLLIHTLFTLRYAQLYYHESDGGIDFNQDDPPRYTDFAYLAFTIGMTFQVSDTDLKTHRIRVAALRHMLLSYLFGAVILATTINLVAGLSSGGG